MQIDDGKKARATLKAYFKKNAIPTEEQFKQLIDSALNQRDDGVVKEGAGPLSIEATGDDAGPKRAIDFYLSRADPDPAFSIALRASGRGGDSDTPRFAWSVNDSKGNSRLSIDAASGNVGIGEIVPTEKLVVDGRVRASTLSIGPWPANPSGFAFVGSNLLDQAAPGNYALLVGTGADGGATLLNSPTRISIRIDNSDRMTILGNNVGIGTTTPRGKLEIAGGALMPSAGDGEGAGILFPPDPGGGGSDRAWMRYFSRGGETMTLEIGTSNDPDDHIALMPSGNVGIGTRTPRGKLDVTGTMFVDGDVTFGGSLKVGGSDLYFTKIDHNHTGFGNTPGFAAIENTANFGALMILGRSVNPAGAAVRRVVKLWDYLQVNGTLEVNGQLAGLNVADNGTAIVRCADFTMGHSTRRRSPGRALVDSTDTLVVNWGPDWPKTLIDGQTTITHLVSGSSRALKDDIVPLPSGRAAALLDDLDPVAFTWKTNGQRASLGFIAENCPADVLNDEGDGIYFNHIVAALTRCVKDQQVAIADLTRRLATVGA